MRDPRRRVDDAADTAVDVDAPGATSPPETGVTTDTEPTDAATSDTEPTDAATSDTEPTDAATSGAAAGGAGASAASPGGDATAEGPTADVPAGSTANRPAPAGKATAKGPSLSKVPSSPSGDDPSARAAAPTPAARPTSTGSSRSERSSNRRPTGGAGTATLERPAPRSTRGAPVEASDEGQRSPGRLTGLGERLRRAGGSRALPIVLVAVIVVCAALAGLAAWKGRTAWTEGPIANQAVVDVGGTAELIGQTRQAIEQIFSYDPTKLDESVNAARTLSTGDFTRQYLEVFDRTIRGPATQQQLRQTASVLNIGAMQMTGDRATVMALVQFTAERTPTRQTTNAPGLLRLDMERVDGRWKLEQLRPLTATP